MCENSLTDFVAILTEVRTACGSGRLISKSNDAVVLTCNRPLPQAVLTSWGECRKDYITLAVNQRALWSVIAPAVATPCSNVFSILSPRLNNVLVIVRRT